MNLDLRKLNSMTKYPSIETYHVLGEKGRLTEQVMPFQGQVYVHEKIDGTNARIIIMSDGDFYIGSRENLLHARYDRIDNPTEGIVAALKSAAFLASDANPSDMYVHVLFGEVYGKGVGSNHKQYATSSVGFRLFDVMSISEMELHNMMTWSIEKIALWRDHGNQNFNPYHDLHYWSQHCNIERAPHIWTLDAVELPVQIVDTYNWLHTMLPQSYAQLDEGAGGRAEGVVLRTADRSTIAKARFEDYERTMKVRK